MFSLEFGAQHCRLSNKLKMQVLIRKYRSNLLDSSRSSTASIFINENMYSILMIDTFVPYKVQCKMNFKSLYIETHIYVRHNVFSTMSHIPIAKRLILE